MTLVMFIDNDVTKQIEQNPVVWDNMTTRVWASGWPNKVKLLASQHMDHAGGSGWP